MSLSSCIFPANAPRLQHYYSAMTMHFIAQLPQECYETYDSPCSMHEYLTATLSIVLQLETTSGDSPASERKTIVRASYGCLTFSENLLEVCNFVCYLPQDLTPVVKRRAKRLYDWCETGFRRSLVRGHSLLFVIKLICCIFEFIQQTYMADIIFKTKNIPNKKRNTPVNSLKISWSNKFIYRVVKIDNRTDDIPYEILRYRIPFLM